MSEQLEQPTLNPNLPSGFLHVESYPEAALVSDDQLPWLDGSAKLSLASCEVQNGQTFLLANAVGTHPNLIAAAESMNGQQQKSVNNMFYSRIQSFVENGHAPNVETMNNQATEFPIHVMRNKSGQRVYFGLATLQGESGSSLPVVIRLGACDKNKQGLVMSVLADISGNSQRRKSSRGSK
jgi:hypothetical protein